MKKRISATVEEETIQKIVSLMKKDNFRNKSHLIEIAINNLFEGEQNE